MHCLSEVVEFPNLHARLFKDREEVEVPNVSFHYAHGKALFTAAALL